MDSFDSQFQDLLNDDDEFETVTSSERVNPYKVERTPLEQAEVDAKKERGEVPSGKKTSKAEVTDLDARQILEPLAIFRALTRDQMSRLTIAGDGPMTKGRANLHNPASVSNRLSRLKNAGLVEYKRVAAGPTIWGATKEGIDTAVRFGRVGAEGQIDNGSVRGINTSQLAHLEAVNWVAMQALSPAEYSWKKLVKLPKKLTLNMIMTEHQINKIWVAVNRELSELRKGGDGFKIPFREWRREELGKARDDAKFGRIAWADLMAWHPGLWVPAHVPSMGEDLNAHHIPDLVINLEQFRKSESRVSIACEIELNAKTLHSYTKQANLWRKELVAGVGSEDPTVYAALLFFTNDPTAKKYVELVAADLIEAGLLIICPLTGFDGLTPLRLTNRT